MAANLPALDAPDLAFADAARRVRTLGRRRRSGAREAVALAAVALVALAATLLDAPVAVRAPLGLALVLLVPGHALARLGDPSRRSLTAVSLAIAMALSLSVAALAALGLDAAGLSVVGDNLAVVLAAVTLAAAAGIAARRTVAGHARSPRPTLARSRMPALFLAAAAVVVGASVALSHVGAVADDRADHFTELWAVPTAAGASGAVQLGVRNHEGGSRTYRLTVAGPRGAGAGEITLADGATWTAPLDPPFGRGPATVTLDLAGHASPYRRVTVAVPLS